MSCLGFPFLRRKAHLSIAKGTTLQCTGGWEMLPSLMQWCRRPILTQNSAGIMAKPSKPVQSAPSSQGPFLPLTAFRRTVAKQEPHDKTLHRSLPESWRQAPTKV